MRILGIDFGERRIGLAISDPDGRLALPLTTLVRTSDQAAVAEIVALARREEAEAFVLGEPLTLDGERGPAARRVRRFGRRLASVSGRPVTYVTETLTSVQARDRLREAGLDPARNRERIDAVAAQILLEEALERRRQEREA